jgi:predicted DCC family thiol-disulfide oxidoreductase YuxK
MPKGNTAAEQTREYLWLSKLGERFPRLRQMVLKLFAIDLRALALTRIAIASIVLIDLFLRAQHLKAFYSDDGLVPRSVIYESFPRSWFFSLHFLSGRAEVEALMFAISGLFALMLLVGYKSRLASFLSWLLFASLCVRNPFIDHGADSLLKMLLFWGMFVPWGARYSIESALSPRSNILPGRIISIGTVALLLQMPLVYFFGGLVKNGLEWRHDFTAISYALSAPDFALPLGTWLLSCTLCLKALTAVTLVLEIAGALLLFFPFHTKTVRLVVMVAFLFLQVGIALTLNLGLFPLVSIVGLLPFLPGPVLDNAFGRFRRKQRPGLRIYYDADCGFCKKSLRLIKAFLLLPEAQLLAAKSDPNFYADMLRHNSWIVVDDQGNRHFKFEGLIEILRRSPFAWPGASLLRWRPFKAIGHWLYELVANNRGILTRVVEPLRYRRLTVNQPLWAMLLCAFFLVFVVVDNFGSLKRSPIRIPGKLATIGQFFNIHQAWRMFAPSPPRASEWYVVVGKLRDGSEIDLFTHHRVSWDKPENIVPWMKKNGWREYLRHLGGERYPALRPYFARYVCYSWNKAHDDGQRVDEVTVYKLEEPIQLTGPAKEASKSKLMQQPCQTSAAARGS